ncbi:hypothetical protein LAUMK191_03180 [Mycobacterium attenuatum]|uniref:Uncharacterized protein n=1 Tax=Mycobacterium attenuatum TaxID=2341086 RepID=A0A498Q5B0_9MYCO|nr:hypothetical protein LAUMK136_03208 [Mycobacterium attenuatum]VBA54749.1 hypothetical protein LAUMK191_03180 [Mycobacterium attenuatum]VBA58973.1 hypothetical protein LAUMK41_03246 [Mycobacterium attenuatum]
MVVEAAAVELAVPTDEPIAVTSAAAAASISGIAIRYDIAASQPAMY